MRLMMVQTALRIGRRSRNLANMTAAVGHAAKSTPAPDLIVLPNCADPRIALVDARDALTPAMCQSLTATLSWEAREWGVWIAAGHTAPVDQRIVPGATLFDADGDAVLRAHRQDDGISERPLCNRAAATPLGVLAIDYLGPQDRFADLTPLDPSVDLHLVFNGGPDHRADAADWARTHTSAVCLMNRGLWDNDEPNAHPPHTLFDATGAVRMETDSTPPGAVQAELFIDVRHVELFPLPEEPDDVE